MLGLRPRALLASLAFAIAASVNAQVIWDEGVNGDLSGDRLAPTSLALNLGSNLLIASSQPEDREYVHFSLPSGLVLSQIIVEAYQSNDPLAFIGVQEGTTFTEPHENTEVGNLLGYALFGTDHVGTDILPDMGDAFGTIQFTPPLTGSDYTFWIQQTGDPCTYTLNFVTAVPEPGTLAVLGGLALAMVRRRKRA